MESPHLRNICHCPRSNLQLSSTLLFLSWILPTSSFAQLTTPLSSSNTPSPTTLSTSTTPSSSPSSNPPATPTQPNSPPPTTSTTNSSTKVAAHAFNYYFLILAVIAVLFCCCILWFGRRKKRKAALMRRQSQRALARDVEGWRTRFRAGLGNNAGHDDRRVEGLDERGEAPPPYAPGSKPPSIRTEDERRSTNAGNRGDGVELRRMSGEAPSHPPGYHEAANRGTEEDLGDITRPRMAVTTPERFGSMSRLLSDTRSSSQA